MNVRRLLDALRWAVLLVAALFVAGVFPFASNGASGLTGTAGPINVTSTSDGHVVTVHAEAPQGIVIYSLTGHICMPNKVTGDHAFDFTGPFCANAPVGDGDVEKQVVQGGGASGDLAFRVGTGTVNWKDLRGFPHTLTCGEGNPCDLVVRIEITNTTVYYQDHLCFGTTCAPDAALPPPATGGDGLVAVGAGGVAVTPGVGNPPATTSAPATTAAPTAASAGKKPDGGGGGSGTAAGTADAKSGSAASDAAATSSHSSSPSGGDDSLSAARQASNVTAAESPSRGVRVFVAAIAGALGAARIISVLGRGRRRGLGTA